MKVGKSPLYPSPIRIPSVYYRICFTLSFPFKYIFLTTSFISYQISPPTALCSRAIGVDEKGIGPGPRDASDASVSRSSCHRTLGIAANCITLAQRRVRFQQSPHQLLVAFFLLAAAQTESLRMKITVTVCVTI